MQLPDLPAVGLAKGAVMSDVTTPPPEQCEERTVDEALVERARREGVELVGPGGLLTGLTKTVLETALEAEMDEHLAIRSTRLRVGTGATRATAAAQDRIDRRRGRSRSRSLGIAMVVRSEDREEAPAAVASASTSS